MKEIIDKLILNSKIAQSEIINKKDNKINKLILNVVRDVLSNDFNKKISKMAVKETGFGNLEDKIEKNNNKTLNLINEVLPIKTFELYSQKNKKIFKILKPIGVICGSTPSTNPIATTLNYFINSIKCKNSLIICPNIRTYKTISFLTTHIRKKILKHKINPDVISLVPKNLLRDENLIYLFNSTDKNIITGNKQIIDKVKKSTKPYLVFGTGNAVIIIENSADINLASKSIIESKSFDNSTSCSSDSIIMINEKIYQNVIKKFKNDGFFILNEKQKKKLDNIFFKKGFLNPMLIAKSAKYILNKLGIQNDNAKVIGYEIGVKNLNHYILLEKLLPISAIIKVHSSQESMEVANKLINNLGKGHSCGIFSKNKSFIKSAAKKIDVSRVIVNQPHSKSAGGSKNNSLNTTLSLGCGAWGESNIDHNLYYEDFCNKTLIVEKNNRKFLTIEELVSKYG